MKAAVDLAVQQFGRLDCVHANAGVLRNQKITDITLDDFHALINVNLLGPVLVAKHAIPVMERQGQGVICFTTSVAADIGFPGHGVYCASKAAVVALMRCLTTDHSPQGVRFVAVSPGTIDTPMLAASCAGWDTPKDELYAQVAKKIPVQRMGQPIDVAHAVGVPVERRGRLHQRQRHSPGRRHAVPAAVVASDCLLRSSAMSASLYLRRFMLLGMLVTDHRPRSRRCADRRRFASGSSGWMRTPCRGPRSSPIRNHRRRSTT